MQICLFVCINIYYKYSNNHCSLQIDGKDAQMLICCGCLGDQSDGINEIVECDGCGVTVHEACYGVSDSLSLASTDSVSPTTPWFCEACKAGKGTESNILTNPLIHFVIAFSNVSNIFPNNW